MEANQYTITHKNMSCEPEQGYIDRTAAIVSKINKNHHAISLMKKLNGFPREFIEQRNNFPFHYYIMYMLMTSLLENHLIYMAKACQDSGALIDDMIERYGIGLRGGLFQSGRNTLACRLTALQRDNILIPEYPLYVENSWLHFTGRASPSTPRSGYGFDDCPVALFDDSNLELREFPLYVERFSRQELMEFAKHDWKLTDLRSRPMVSAASQYEKEKFERIINNYRRSVNFASESQDREVSGVAARLIEYYQAIIESEKG